MGKAGEAQTGGESAEGEQDAAEERPLAKTKDGRAKNRHLSTVVSVGTVEKLRKSL